MFSPHYLGVGNFSYYLFQTLINKFFFKKNKINMNYEEEQKKYAEELRQLCSQLQALEKVLEDSKLVDYKIQCCIK